MVGLASTLGSPCTRLRLHLHSPSRPFDSLILEYMPRWGLIALKHAKTTRNLPSLLRNRHLLISVRNVTTRSLCNGKTEHHVFHSKINHLTAWRRSLSLDSITTILLPPAVFVSLVLALWTYKCLMMVLFQNKIIYMPSIPPFSRSEKISDYALRCSPVTWKEKKIQSLDDTVIALCVGNIPAPQKSTTSKQVTILYFQGYVN